MEKKLSMKKKMKILQANGWYQVWDEDVWLEKDKNYLTSHWDGLSTIEAYEEFLHTKEQINDSKAQNSFEFNQYV